MCLEIFFSVKEEFEYTLKGVIRIHNSKDRQHNGQRKKDKKNQQRSTKHTHKINNRVTRTPLKSGGELRYTRRVNSSCSTSGTRPVEHLILWFHIFVAT